MRSKSWLVGAALAAAVLLGITAAARSPRAPVSWRHDTLWDDGRAEFCVYEVTWAHYGNRYPGRAFLVTVKEPWAPELDVKADRPRSDGFDVLKLNHARDVATGIYTYHQMASIYIRRDDGSLRKCAASSAELCGISTADMTGGVLRTRSYFDGQADRTQPWPAGALPEDGLPVLLRDYVEAEPPASVTVFPSLLAGRYRSLETRTMSVRRTRRDRVEVPAGAFPAVEIRLQDAAGFLDYTFEMRPPHRLLQFIDDSGTTYRLVKGERLAYWEQHDPGDESWLPPALR